MYLCFDIGGTKTRIAASLDGKALSETKIIPTPADFESGIETLKNASTELSHGEKIQGIAGGIAGPLDKEKTCLSRSPHVPGWIGKPLKRELEKFSEVPVKLENDTAIEGLGEANAGVGKDKKIVAFINIGTGIGGVRIVEGKIDKNVLGFEPGHQITIPDGNPCTCGGKGHWETYVGGHYLEEIYRQNGENITDPQIWDEISKYTAIGLTNVAVHWSPDIIILGGSVAKSIPLEKVKAYLDQYLTIFPQAPQIVRGILGNDAGLYGALELLK